MDDSPAVEAGKYVIGKALNIKPDGATFKPALRLTLYYTDDSIPAGTDMDSLTMAYYIESEGRWEYLDCTVNTQEKSVSADIVHFTPYAIIGEKATQTTVRPVLIATKPEEKETEEIDGSATVKPEKTETTPIPATFSISNLAVSSEELAAGESLTVTASITNTGEVSGSYLVELKIDGEVKDSQRVTLDAKETQEVSFTFKEEIEGTHSVEIGGQIVTFSVVEPFSWYLIAEIIGGLIVLGLLIYLATRLLSRAQRTTR
jgi:hypothetical protein